MSRETRKSAAEKRIEKEKAAHKKQHLENSWETT